jgi:SAM domain (Sterile alpha motif)
MDVVVWLRSLGLEEYEVAFRENKVDAAVLPKLTAEDLKDLGIAAVGDRRKLLDAIAALRTDRSGKASSSDKATAPSATSVFPEDRAERRQVTVMFSDLVGKRGAAAARATRLADVVDSAARPGSQSPAARAAVAVFSDCLREGSMRTTIIVASLALALLTGTAWGNDTDSANELLPACRMFHELPSPSVTLGPCSRKHCLRLCLLRVTTRHPPGVGPFF